MNFIQLRNELADLYEWAIPIIVFIIAFLHIGTFIDSMIKQGHTQSLFVGIVAQISLVVGFMSYQFRDIDKDVNQDKGVKDE